MAKIIIDNIPYDVPDGNLIAEACEVAGIPFSCNSGVCGSCQIEILEGAENINELNKITKTNKNEIGVIIMEVARYKDVNLPFLQAVRDTAKKIINFFIVIEVIIIRLFY